VAIGILIVVAMLFMKEGLIKEKKSTYETPLSKKA
jgi:ABC-type branched-subunit amino acid transport system permease subunit